MCPASWKTAVTPSVTVDLHVVVGTACLAHGRVDVALVVERLRGSRSCPLGGLAQPLGQRLVVGPSRSTASDSDLRVRRLCRARCGVAPVPARGELDLQLRRVAQHDLREVDRGAGGVDRPAIAGAHQCRDAPAVVEVGVREQHRVQRRRRRRRTASGCARPPAGSPGTCRSRRACGASPAVTRNCEPVTQPAAPRNWMLMLICASPRPTRSAAPRWRRRARDPGSSRRSRAHCSAIVAGLMPLTTAPVAQSPP